MKILTFLLCAAIVSVNCEERKWVWGQDEQKIQRSDSPRYQIYERPEGSGEFEHGRPFVGSRPQSTGFNGHQSNRFPPEYHGNKGILVGPGGPTGIVGRPHNSGFYRPDSGLSRPPYHGNDYRPGKPDYRPYRPGSGRYDNYDYGELDYGSVPSWIREDPRYREYDTCRCRYSFNCPSTGLKFGSCSGDKRYCCYNSRRYPELSGYPNEGHYYPNYPPHNHGPHRFPPSNPYKGHEHDGNYYGNYGRPYGHAYGYHTGDNQGPYNRPYDGPFDIYSRSAEKNQTQPVESADKSSAVSTEN